MSPEKHRYILQDVRRLAGERGLEFTWPVDREPVWEVPHLGYLAAARHGVGAQYIALAARARWELGLDICDRTVIAGFAAELGLDAEELATASDDSGLRAEGVRVLLEIQRDGVFGVPFFVDHFDKYWGVDRLPAFAAALAAKTAADLTGSRTTPGTPFPYPRRPSTTVTRAGAAEPVSRAGRIPRPPHGASSGRPCGGRCAVAPRGPGRAAARSRSRSRSYSCPGR